MSLDGVYDEHNIFAKILRGDIGAHKVYEDDVALSFLDLFPQSRGHTLVIPKYPARNLFDIPTASLCELIIRTQTIAKAVAAALRPEGVVITQFNGTEAGQTVFHLHFHILPRYAGELAAVHGRSGPADAAELTAIADAIKKHLLASA